jgi:transposase
MRRVIGMDIHRTFAEVVFWEDGKLRPAGRVSMTHAGLEGFGRSLGKEDEVVIEATGNAMAVVRVLAPYVARVIVANPLQVKAIAHAHVKTDKIDAGVLASLRAADFLPEIWLPDADTERLRRLVARRNQVVQHRTRIKNEVHSILHAHLIPPCPHADLFGRLGRAWLVRQVIPDDERAAIERHLRELDRLGEDLGVLDREIAQAAIQEPAVKRLLTITGVNLIVAAGLVAAIGDVRRFPDPQKLVSYVGLNPRVRQSGLGLAQHGRISKRGRSHARAMLVEAAWAASKAPGPLRAFFLRIRARRGHQIAAVAVARKLAVLCWYLLTKDVDYQWARPALIANKLRAMELQAGRPVRKGTSEATLTRTTSKSCAIARSISPAMPNKPTSGSSANGSGAAMGNSARVPQVRNDAEGCAVGLASSSPTLCRAVTRAGPG